MIVEMEVTIPLKYLKYVKDNLNKIKLPLTDNQEKDVTNRTALIMAKSNLEAVISNLGKAIKNKEEEYNDQEEDIFREANDFRGELNV